MILYNITINIDRGIHDEWMAWMRNKYIPQMLDTGLFLENKILKLLNEDKDNPGVTYSFQFFTSDMPSFLKFQRDFEVNILSLLYQRYKDRFVEFRTILEVQH